MKVKYWIVFSMGMMMVASCSNSVDDKQVVTTERDSTEQTEVVDSVATASVAASQLVAEFPQLFRYMATQDSSFTGKNFEGGSFSPLKDTLAAQPISEEEIQNMHPYLVVNNDSSKAIDMVTNNYVVKELNGKKLLRPGGPDTELAVIDLKDHKRQRIFFTGPQQILLDARWAANGDLVFVLADDLGNQNITPKIYRYRPQEKAFEIFTYPGKVQADISDYAEKNLNEKAGS